MTLLMREQENRKDERRTFARLIMAIPQGLDDYTLALTAADDNDIIKSLYDKYTINIEE